MSGPDATSSQARFKRSQDATPGAATSAQSFLRQHAISLAPALAAAAYPFLLMLFHAIAGPPGSQLTGMAIAGAGLTLMLAFSVSAIGMTVACLPRISTPARRVAYLSVAAPSLYVFLGVIQALVQSPIPDPWVWCAIWTIAAAIAFRDANNPEVDTQTRPDMGRWRIAHGISAMVLLAYVLFHLGNHLAGWVGPDAHAAVMEVGRTVYRAKFLEPLLVIAFLFQAVSGLYLAWHWSAARHDAYRTFQVASGVYLSVFIVGHMNSVFIYARTYLGIPTDWAFAAGAPTGLIHDPWNIRLLPHYALGVFFVLGHVFTGLRVVLNAHGVNPKASNGILRAGLVASAAIAAAIIAAMCGARI